MEYAQGIITKSKSLLLSKYNFDIEPVILIRHELHKHPELAFKEFNTKQLLINFLKNGANFDQTNIKTFAKTGFTYDIRGRSNIQNSYPLKIGLRADMDALPIQELTNLPYSSIYPNIAHSCGHDGNMAILLGAAEIFLKNASKIPSNSTIRLIFQPAEECGQGAKLMVNEGALKNIDEIYAMHSWSNPIGTFGISKEHPMTTSMSRFRIDINGLGTHGAYPENGKDPITAICQIHNSIHKILSQNISRKEYAVCTIGEIHAGKAENVIPNYATMGGTIRTFDQKIQAKIKLRLSEIVKNISEAYGCQGKINYISEIPAVVNNPKQADFFRNAVSDLFGPQAVTSYSKYGSEDFSFMSYLVPGAYMNVGYHNENKKLFFNHNPKFDFNDELLAPCILIWLKLMENRFNINF